MLQTGAGSTRVTVRISQAMESADGLAAHLVLPAPCLCACTRHAQHSHSRTPAGVLPLPACAPASRCLALTRRIRGPGEPCLRFQLVQRLLGLGVRLRSCPGHLCTKGRQEQGQTRLRPLRLRLFLLCLAADLRGGSSRCGQAKCTSGTSTTALRCAQLHLATKFHKSLCAVFKFAKDCLLCSKHTASARVELQLLKSRDNMTTAFTHWHSCGSRCHRFAPAPACPALTQHPNKQHRQHPDVQVLQPRSGAALPFAAEPLGPDVGVRGGRDVLSEPLGQVRRRRVQPPRM
eukprot:3439712-Rhodomonas_salina.1